MKSLLIALFTPLLLGVDYLRGLWFLRNINPTQSVAIFGSARIKESHSFYPLGYHVGKIFAENRYTVITGGGPGIMEAASQGAFQNHGITVGCNIILPHEQNANPYLTRNLNFMYFSTRKQMLFGYSETFVFLPGGYGTLDELFELLTLLQTEKIKTKNKPRIILIDQRFWGTLHQWIQEQLVNHQLIDAEDFAQLIVIDKLDELKTLLKT